MNRTSLIRNRPLRRLSLTMTGRSRLGDSALPDPPAGKAYVYTQDGRLRRWQDGRPWLRNL